MQTLKKTLFLTLVSTLLFGSSLSAITLDELVAKNLEARGGADAWSKVETMTLTGNFTAFSESGTFTWHRTHDNQMLMTYEMMNMPVSTGYDGENVWQKTPMAGPWPDLPSGVERAQILQDVEFVNPLYQWKEKGYELTLVGETKIDGMAALQVEVKRPEGPDETWYFDPDTYLEIARDGVGADMGTETFPLRTIFDDFRKVNGVMIPHWFETEWYTRHRVFEVTGVEVNPEIAESVFGLPVSTGMENLQGMKGTWDVKVEVRRRPGAPWNESRAKAEIVTFMNGGLIVEHYQSDNVEIMRSLTYDPFRNTYRMSSVHGQRPYHDILEGTWQEATESEGEGEGAEEAVAAKLSLNNAKTDTSLSMFGQDMHSGWAIGEVSEDGFVVELSTSRDAGENWFNEIRLTYAKPGTLDPMEEPAGAE